MKALCREAPMLPGLVLKLSVRPVTGAMRENKSPWL